MKTILLLLCFSVLWGCEIDNASSSTGGHVEPPATVVPPVVVPPVNAPAGTEAVTPAA